MFSKKLDKDGFKEVGSELPDCKLEITSDGFIVRFSKSGGEDKNWILVAEIVAMSVGVPMVLLRDQKDTPLPLAIAAAVVMFALAFFAANIYFTKVIQSRRTTITVTPDTVTIRGERLRRTHFGGFTYSDLTHRLAYIYGNEKTYFGGLWFGLDDGTIVAAKLNNMMRRAPLSSHEKNPTPEALRQAARPMEF